MPHIEPRITLGNVLSLIGTALSVLIMLATVAAWSGQQEQRIAGNEKEIVANTAKLGNYEVRLRSMEQSSARFDERITLILDVVREIKAKLERGQP